MPDPNEMQRFDVLLDAMLNQPAQPKISADEPPADEEDLREEDAD